MKHTVHEGALNRLAQLLDQFMKGLSTDWRSCWISGWYTDGSR